MLGSERERVGQARMVTATSFFKDLRRMNRTIPVLFIVVVSNHIVVLIVLLAIHFTGEVIPPEMG